MLFRSHRAREVLPPLPQHRLVDVQPPRLGLALSLHDQVHVRVPLMRVKREDVTMCAELLTREGPRGGEHFVRRGTCGHGEHDVVHQLDTRCLRSCREFGSVLACAQLQMPCPEEILLRVFANALTPIGLELDFPLVADVSDVGGNGADAASAAGDFDQDLGYAPEGASDLLDLGNAQALRGTSPSSAKTSRSG